jgi:hypothetical protein
MAVASLALIGVLANVQVVRADTYAVKPHLGMQADGVRRYQYNPRLLDVLVRFRGARCTTGTGFRWRRPTRK